jgi:hypothetical protein
MRKKISVTLICVLSAGVCCVAADIAAKPKLKVAADGLPSGHDSPEGVACDLARAFIKRDVGLFTNTCIRMYSGGESRTNYQAFLEARIQRIKDEAAKKEPSPFGPKAIGKLFAARHLSKGGPASYGYASFDFQDVMFVDVGVYLQNGERSLTRTLVIKDRDGKWYAHPAPDVSPLLSMGLNEEDKSTQDFTDAYTIEK